MNRSTWRFALAVAICTLCSACAQDNVAAEEVLEDGMLSRDQTQLRSGSASPDVSFLGLELGKPLSLPNCEPGVVTTCRTSTHVLLADGEVPYFMEDNSISVVEDPVLGLQEIVISTKHQEGVRLLEDAKAKYGPYDFTDWKLLGHKVPSWSWTFSDMDVSFVNYDDVHGMTIRTAAKRTSDDKQRATERAAEEAKLDRQRDL